MTQTSSLWGDWAPTALDIERFTAGDCHYLARAIHKLTGWPMAAFSATYGEPDLHAFVSLPDGRVLDVQGACSLHDMRKRWSTTRAKTQTFSWDELKVFGPPEYGASVARARIVARRLLAGLEA